MDYPRSSYLVGNLESLTFKAEEGGAARCRSGAEDSMTAIVPWRVRSTSHAAVAVLL